MPIRRDAVVVLRITPTDRQQWDAIKGKIRAFIQNNPEVKLDQPLAYEERDDGNP